MVDAPAFVPPDAALARFREVLPADAVHVDEADRDQLRDPYWFQEDRSYDSSAVLYPTTVEQIQAIEDPAQVVGLDHQLIGSLAPIVGQDVVEHRAFVLGRIGVR